MCSKQLQSSRPSRSSGLPFGRPGPLVGAVPAKVLDEDMARRLKESNPEADRPWRAVRGGRALTGALKLLLFNIHLCNG